MTGGVLCLDLSLHTGWAYGTPGGEPLSGVWHLAPNARPGASGASLIDRLTDMVRGQQPSLIVCEAPLRPQAQSNVAAARSAFGLAFAVELVGHWMDVDVMEESSDDVRRAMMGRSRFAKDTVKDHVMAWCHAKGWSPPDHNAADASMLWAHTCAEIAKRKWSR